MCGVVKEVSGWPEVHTFFGTTRSTEASAAAVAAAAAADALPFFPFRARADGGGGMRTVGQGEDPLLWYTDHDASSGTDGSWRPPAL